MNVPTTTIQVAYPITPEGIGARLDQYRGYAFDTPENYKSGVLAIRSCRELRVEIEERRKFLKADSLAYGREVDRVAGILTGLIQNVEGPLQASKQLVDDTKKREKEAKAAAERQAIEDQLLAARAVEEAIARAARAEEEKALAAQRAELAAERKAAQAELAKIRAEREALDKAQREADAVVMAKAIAERKLAEAEEARIHQLEWAETQRKRQAALAPDAEKLKLYAEEVHKLLYRQPTLASNEAQAVLVAVSALLSKAQLLLEGWKP